MQHKTDANSPNGCFERHGFYVHREPKGNGPARRTIVSPVGELVLQGAGYEAEHAFCVSNALMQEVA
jgi:hypothetical protein